MPAPQFDPGAGSRPIGALAIAAAAVSTFTPTRRDTLVSETH